VGGKTARRNIEAAAARGCCVPVAKARSTSRVHATVMSLGAHRDVGRALLGHGDAELGIQRLGIGACPRLGRPLVDPSVR